jgi:hypothetical protein
MKDYHSRLGLPVSYSDEPITSETILIREQEPKEYSSVWLSLPVLEYLYGQKWDAVALAVASSLNPDRIRVTTGEVTCDSHVNRMTVLVDSDDIIRYISMECKVRVPTELSDVHCGHDLYKLLVKYPKFKK